MNCKQTEELLPLYAGGDLEEKRAGRVSAHLQSCAACNGVVQEYREARQLAQQFTPPVFSEATYAGIRERVLHEIQTEATAPRVSDLLASLFRPRLRWAYAAALLAVSVSAIYFIASRRSPENQLAKNPPAASPERNGQKGDEGSDGNQTLGPTVPGATPRPSISINKHTRRKHRDAVDGGTGATARNASEPSVTGEASSNSNLTESAVVPAVNSAPSEKTLRMEIQTRDPNIRIIWFSQSNSKPALPNSKGI